MRRSVECSFLSGTMQFHRDTLRIAMWSLSLHSRGQLIGICSSAHDAILNGKYSPIFEHIKEECWKFVSTTNLLFGLSINTYHSSMWYTSMLPFPYRVFHGMTMLSIASWSACVIILRNTQNINLFLVIYITQFIM